jgi:hypothetical protein
VSVRLKFLKIAFLFSMDHPSASVFWLVFFDVDWYFEAHYFLVERVARPEPVALLARAHAVYEEGGSVKVMIPRRLMLRAAGFVGSCGSKTDIQ